MPETKLNLSSGKVRRRGLRLMEIWVLDVRSRAFKTQAHRQSLAIVCSEDERKDQAFIDAVADPDE